MARPIKYYFIAVESYGQGRGNLRVMEGQTPYDYLRVAYEGRCTHDSNSCIITVGTVTDKNGGDPYVYAHKDYYPIIVPKELAEKCIKDGRLGFTEKARWKNEPKISADEFRHWFLGRYDYQYTVDNLKSNYFDRETAEGQLLDNAYLSVRDTINLLAARIAKPMTYYEAETLRQFIGTTILQLAVVKNNTRDIINAYRKVSSGKSVTEVLGKTSSLWRIDL